MLSREVSCGKVKGKQVKFLHDLVTVIAERYAIRATERSGRRYTVLRHKSGNLPFCWYMAERSRSRGIDRTVSRLPEGGLFIVPSAFAEGIFYAVMPL